MGRANEYTRVLAFLATADPVLMWRSAQEVWQVPSSLSEDWTIWADSDRQYRALRDRNSYVSQQELDLDHCLACGILLAFVKVHSYFWFVRASC